MPVSSRGGSVNDFINQSKKPLVKGASSGGGKVDNSFHIAKVEVKIDGSSMPEGKASIAEARKQAQYFMKELRKIVIEEKSRQGDVSFEDILLSYM
jgi:hypothetical protein